MLAIHLPRFLTAASQSPTAPCRRIHPGRLRNREFPLDSSGAGGFPHPTPGTATIYPPQHMQNPIAPIATPPAITRTVLAQLFWICHSRCIVAALHETSSLSTSHHIVKLSLFEPPLHFPTSPAKKTKQVQMTYK